VLPLPRRRLDPDVVRERLALLAGGLIVRQEEPEAAWESPPSLLIPEGSPGAPDDEPAAVVSRTSLRPVVVAVAATALVAWIVVRVTVGGTPSTVQVVPGTPLPSGSGVLVASSSGPSGSAASPSSSAVVVVQVVGQVRKPGLVTLPLGARVADAVAAAGGLTRGGSSGGLNLARQVVDGEQIVVSPDAVAVAATTASGGSGDAVLDLNAATLSDLDSLPGVGPVMAGRILDWRTAHGRFSTVDQLREISGIGARTFERLKPHVRV